MALLPPELWDHIINFLPVEEVIKCKLISPFFLNLIKNSLILTVRIFIYKVRKTSPDWAFHPEKIMKIICCFQQACIEGKLKIVKFLDKRYHLIPLRLPLFQTFLLKTVSYRDDPFLNCLIHDIKNHKNFALIYVCGTRNIKVNEYLIYKAKIIKKDLRIKNDCIIKLICLEGEIELLKFIHEKFGLDRNMIGPLYSRSAFSLACFRGNFEIVQYLKTVLDIKNLPSPSSYMEHPLKMAYDNGQKNMVKYIIDNFGLTYSDLYMVGGTWAVLSQWTWDKIVN